MVFERWINTLGVFVLQQSTRLGAVGLFLFDTFVVFFTTKLKVKKFFNAMNYIGVASLGVVAMIGITSGAVLALQSYVGLSRFGGEQYIGPIVFIAMTRELGPVFTAMMVIGRAGSSITAEIGTMRISEQIDALQTLCINTKQYLIVPRVLAGICILPFLSMFGTMLGIFAGYCTSVFLLNINSKVFIESIVENAEFSDISVGLLKAAVFGFLLTVVSTYKGFTTWGGSKGVGRATTQSVVYSNVTIFIANYILTSMFLK